MTYRTCQADSAGRKKRVMQHHKEVKVIVRGSNSLTSLPRGTLRCFRDQPKAVRPRRDLAVKERPFGAEGPFGAEMTMRS